MKKICVILMLLLTLATSHAEIHHRCVYVQYATDELIFVEIDDQRYAMYQLEQPVKLGDLLYVLYDDNDTRISFDDKLFCVAKLR